jgi:hypothetical protein
VAANIYESPDGKLRLVLTAGDDGDVMLGFEGYPWHTHANLLVPSYGPTKDDALKRFVQDIIESRAVIALYRRGGKIIGIEITLDPAEDLRYLAEGETVEHRFWNGSSPP